VNGPVSAPVDLDRWIDALLARHAANLRRPELLKAIRALSVRYVEQRHSLAERSPLDSAGKRAAFAVYYAPLHVLTVQAVVRALDVERQPLRRLLDLGCGTGAAGAAWALAQTTPLDVHGVDAHAWAVTEARWTWTVLGVRGRAARGDLVTTAADLARQNDLHGTAAVLGWSVNELESRARERLQASLVRAARAGLTLIVIEPIGRRIVPWWDAWAAPLVAGGAGRVDEWRFDADLPAALAELRDAAGFRAGALTARSLAILPHADR
jgi:hypothetical protein